MEVEIFQLNVAGREVVEDLVFEVNPVADL